LIEAISIYGFRGFLKAELEGLKRFNVVVGPNASGKTALLEALFLAAGVTPEIAFRFGSWRGMGDNIQIGSDKPSFEALWRDLFFGQEIRPITIQIRDSSRGVRLLRIGYRAQEITLPLGEHSIRSGLVEPLRFEWEAEGKTQFVDVQIVEGKGLVLGAIQSVLPGVFINSSQRPLPQETAARYSELSQANREQGMLEAVQRVYPFITGLSVEITSGQPMLYAAVNGLGSKLPLPMISAGVNRYTSILLAIRAMAGGVVLIDELENGFYYSAMETLLASILEEATRNDTQLFMAIHSMECIRALLPSIEKAPADFQLLRTRRRKQGDCEVLQLPGNRLAAALQEGFEVR